MKGGRGKLGKRLGHCGVETELWDRGRSWECEQLNTLPSK